MDGNARWAKKNNLVKKKGYEKGIEVLRNLIKLCVKNDIKILTVYALSTENTKRKDINILYKLIRKFIKDYDNDEENRFKDLKFNLIGNRKTISKDILNFFQNLEKEKNDYKLIFNLAFNYGSWDELKNCINNIINIYSKNNEKVEINENEIKNNLFTGNIEDPDLLIRTGGEKRLSNFLLLQLKYSELFFLDILWPDFSENHLNNVLDEYKKRKRRYGL